MTKPVLRIDSRGWWWRCGSNLWGPHWSAVAAYREALGWSVDVAGRYFFDRHVCVSAPAAFDFAEPCDPTNFEPVHPVRPPDL